MKKLCSILFIITFFVCIGQKSFAGKPVVISDKYKSDRGLFGFKNVTETQNKTTDPDGTVTIHRMIICTDPGYIMCWFSGIVNCAETGLPFTNIFYNNKHSEIEAEVDAGVLSGNVVEILNAIGCDGNPTYYKCTKSWEMEDSGNGHAEVTVELLPN